MGSLLVAGFDRLRAELYDSVNGLGSAIDNCLEEVNKLREALSSLDTTQSQLNVKFSSHMVGFLSERYYLRPREPALIQLEGRVRSRLRFCVQSVRGATAGHRATKGTVSEKAESSDR